MYDQHERSKASRVIWLIIYVLIAAAITWGILWLLFWRSPNTKISVTKDTPVSINKSGNNSGKTSSTSTTTPGSSTSQNTSLGSVIEELNGKSKSDSSNQTTTTLAATGPSNVFAPAAIAAIGGTVYYHIRLRNKVRREQSE